MITALETNSSWVAKLENPKLVSMRDAYGDCLVRLGSEIPQLVVVGADTTQSIKTSLFGQKFPERFFNVGIAEQNLVSVAAGLSMTGKIAFASTYAVFAPGKCVDQMRNAIAYSDLDVKLVASHAGLSVGPDGASHQELEDIATMRAIPNMRVVVPSDATSTARLVELVAKTKGPFYMRIARPNCPLVYSPEEARSIQIGKGSVLAEGSDATIIACGLLVYEALVAAERLARENNISVSVVDMTSIKPLDSRLVIDLAGRTGYVVTAEEHNVLGGLGGAVCEVLSEAKPTQVRRIGTQDTYGESGEHHELLEKYGLTAKNIVSAVLQLRSNGRK